MKEFQTDKFTGRMNGSKEEVNNSTSVCLHEDSFLHVFYCSPDNWHLALTLLKSLALGLIILLTVFGNVLVLMAVAFSKNLRSSTHYLIVNLAVADLLLGTTVLPFSAVIEITGRWYFGQTFCDVWAAVDVLCCTSSILSLCVISLDRYIGVTRPLAYSSIMVGRRTSALIVLIWTASFVISIGPLLGWREPPVEKPYYCSVNKQLGYVFFSATGSFYLPMLIILSVYWKIYKAAIRQTKFLESGQKTTKQDVTLRIHLGGTIGGRMYNGTRAQSVPDLALMKVTQVKNGKTGKKTKEPQAPSNAVLANACPEVSSVSSHTEEGTPGVADIGTVLRAHRGGGRNSRALKGKKDYNCTWSCTIYNNEAHCKQPDNNGNSGKVANSNRPHPHPPHSRRCNAEDFAGDILPQNIGLEEHNHRNEVPKVRERGQCTSLTPSPPSSSPERKLNAGFGKIAKFRRQKKAAKTLAIVVGVFLGCWFPFFLVLPLGALCGENCIPEWIFNVCFWLGYFNSCLNPVIYACTSREFQRAFRRILCRKAPPRPHISRAIYRANNVNTRFVERDYNGGVHFVGNGDVLPNGISTPPVKANQLR